MLCGFAFANTIHLEVDNIKETTCTNSERASESIQAAKSSIL
jgi:hypothetical protein